LPAFTAAASGLRTGAFFAVGLLTGLAADLAIDLATGDLATGLAGAYFNA
jgi:hypothetical protein